MHEKGWLTDMACKGKLADMFLKSKQSPTQDERRAMTGTRPLTLRDLAETAHRLGFKIDVEFKSFTDDL